ncbi:MAG: hypothetical protein ACFC1C_00060 [Candidatus Malihini olakiniferum]
MVALTVEGDTHHANRDKEKIIEQGLASMLSTTFNALIAAYRENSISK